MNVSHESWLTVAEAAPLLGFSRRTLRAHCRRAPTHFDGLRTVAALGAGVTATKIGRRWRVLIA